MHMLSFMNSKKSIYTAFKHNTFDSSKKKKKNTIIHINFIDLSHFYTFHLLFI